MKNLIKERRTHLLSYDMLAGREADDNIEKWLLISSQEKVEKRKVGVKVLDPTKVREKMWTRMFFPHRANSPHAINHTLSKWLPSSSTYFVTYYNNLSH